MDIVIGESSMLGGVGKILQIDESKFGKRKYIVEAKVWMVDVCKCGEGAE